ncbi:hypothetical protein EON65_47930 [archaeon]|nr:MAG: hypothetical protein EON65_47930 [archaeon]
MHRAPLTITPPLFHIQRPTPPASGAHVRSSPRAVVLAPAARAAAAECTSGVLAGPREECGGRYMVYGVWLFGVCPYVVYICMYVCMYVHVCISSCQVLIVYASILVQVIQSKLGTNAIPVDVSKAVMKFSNKGMAAITDGK